MMRETGLRCRPPVDTVPEITHKELVKHAGLWLRNNSYTHTVVLTELATSCSETPDAIGFSAQGFSTLIECKTSRADFHADKKKYFRRDPENGVGDFRYFMAPAGLLTPEELPENWGLIEIYEKTASGRRRRCETVPATQCLKLNQRNQIGMLVSVMRRLEISTAVFVRQPLEGAIE